MRTIPAVSVLLPLLAAPVVVAQAKPTEITPIPGPVVLEYRPWAEDWVFATRILDALTLQPIRGAVLYEVPERTRQRSGEFWFDGKWTSDADGFLRVPKHEQRSSEWFVLDATGYGPAAHISSPSFSEGPVSLMPGIDWPVAVRDGFDRPVVDADLGLCLGCGHTPDVRVARTGADGVAWLRATEPTGRFNWSGIHDLYVRREGLDPAYGGDHWYEGDSPTVQRQDFAHPALGRVLGPNGRPLRNVIVLSDGGYHRGPCYWTDAEGRFLVLGHGRPEGVLTLELADRTYTARMPAASDTLDLVLPASPLPKTLPTGAVTITVRDAATAQPIAGAAVEIWHCGVQSEADAENVHGSTDAQGACTARVVAGACSCRVRMEAREAPPSAIANYRPPAPLTHDAVVRDFTVEADGTLALAIALAPRVPLAVTLGQGVRSATLITREDSADVGDQILAGTPVLVPRAAPFAFRVDTDAERGDRIVYFPSLPGGPVTLEALPPTRVRARVVDANGRPLAAHVELVDRQGHAWPAASAEDAPPVPNTDADGVVDLTTTIAGCAFVKVRPASPAARRTTAHVSLPQRRGSQAVDLGTISVAAAAGPLLRVLRADGAPAHGQLSLMRPGLRVEDVLASDGGWEGMAPKPGDRVVVDFEDAESTDLPGASTPPISTRVVQLSQQLVGDGPWELREGTGSLVFDVQDDFGLRPDGGVVVFEGQSFQVEDRLELRGLPERDLELFVGAQNCDSLRVRLRLGAKEKRTIQAVLKRPQ